MQRVTITLDDALMDHLDAVIAARGYQNRSEAIRDLVRAGIREAVEEADETGDCVAALVYLYDHLSRQLPRRLTDAFHDHHEMSRASLHVHLDHDTCMEVTVLQGNARKVRRFAEHVMAERGVRYGKIVHMPIEGAKAHTHPHKGEAGGPKRSPIDSSGRPRRASSRARSRT